MAIRISGLNSGMDTESMVQELVKSYSSKTDKLKKDQTRAKWKQEAYSSINTKVKNFYNKLSNLQYSTAYSKKTTNISDSSKVSVVTGDNAVKGTQTVAVNKLAKSGYLTGGEIKDTNGELVKDGNTKLSTLGIGSDTELTFSQGGKTTSIKLNENGTDMTINDVVKKLSSAGVNANFDSNTGRLFVSSKESGAAANFNITALSGDEKSAEALSKLGLDISGGSSNKATKIDGQDAEIELNGAKFTSSTNAFNINGLAITAKDVTKPGETVSLTTDTDYDGIYDTIKDFVGEYSKLINEMDKLYNADTAKGYDPLTAEEKEALTEEEVEEWEKKIKDSLLRRDENISSVANVLKNAMSSVYEIGGSKLSLSNFGIETLGYFNAADNEKNAYHIAGDKDDKDTSGQTDKLKAAIASDPTKVAGFFQKLAGSMYDSLQKISSSSSTRTFGNFYDDKKVKEDYESYENKLSDWEDYVAKIEDKYYKQFSAMETAMSKLNSQQTYVQNMFGM